MSIKALITLRETQWSGWIPGGHTSTISAQVWAEARTVLSPETVGHPKSRSARAECWFYEVVIDRIVADIVVFAYRNLVVANPGGGINLTAPTRDRFILRWGETKSLATPTMDAGIGVEITLNEIRAATPEGLLSP
jgi:hypothetical protein